MPETAPDGRAGIDVALVRRLLAAQAPQWAGLPIGPVAADGWDNRTYRLGDELTVRLPTHEMYAAAVEKEHRWLPVLAPKLPQPIPEPVFLGVPGDDLPLPWSVRRWLPGMPASTDTVGDPKEFATNLADFLVALHGLDAADGPLAGGHSFFRGAPPAHYDDETRRSLAQLGDVIDVPSATAVWDDALASAWPGEPVWFHGDVAVGNLLVDVTGELSAVIDFGTSGVGDPACDLVIAWTFFTGDPRRRFRATIGLDDDTWARARGWALWKSAITLVGAIDVQNHAAVADDRRIMAEILSDRR